MNTRDQLEAFEAGLRPVEPWPELAEESVPMFPTELLPEPCRSLVEGIAASSPVLVDYAVCAMLGAASSALVGRVAVQPLEDYQQPLQLYLCMGGESGTNKSGPMNKLIAPLAAWLNANGREIRRRNRLREDERKRIQARQARGKKAMTDSDLQELRRQLDALENEPELPVILTDTTPEALSRRMARQGGCGIIYTDEGSFINVLAGRTYSQKGGAPNMDTALQGFDGKPIFVDRAGAEEIDLERANLSITVAMQPALLRIMTENAELADRGFPQRVLYFLPDDPGPANVLNLPKPPKAAQAAWGDLLVRLASIHRAQEAVLPLTSGAQEVYKNHRQDMQNRTVGDMGGCEALRAWARKAHGKTARLAGLLALLENPDAREVEEGHVRAAVEMMNAYFIPHVKKAFGGSPSLSPDALAMVDTLRGLESIPKSELRHKLSGQKKYKGNGGDARFSQVLQELTAGGYIRLTSTADTGRPGRRPGLLVEVNPALRRKAAQIQRTEGTL